MGQSLLAVAQVNAHNVTLVVAAVLGLASLVWVARLYGIEPGFAVDAALAALLVGIVAGRVEVVVANLDYFRERSWQVLVDPRIGGLGQRSLTAVGLAAYLAIVAQRTNWRYYAAAIAPAVGLASAVAWAGFAFTGAAAGGEGVAPLVVSLPDAYGITAPRFPLQFVMAGGHLLLAIAALLLLNRVLRPGVGLGLYATAAGALSALMDSFRAEVVYLAPGIPRALVADAALSLVWLLAAGALLAFGRRAVASTPSAEAEPAAGAQEEAAVQA